MKELKQRLRKEILEKRLALTAEEIEEKSILIKEKLFALKRFEEAASIMFYASFKNEVDTFGMIEDAICFGKKIALPVTSRERGIAAYFIQDLKKDIAPGNFGVPEPKIKEGRGASAAELNMIVVPGIVFGRNGSRIGFGRGYYDRFLRSLSPRPFCVGLGFELQVVDAIPAGPFDEKVDMVITEAAVYNEL